MRAFALKVAIAYWTVGVLDILIAIWVGLKVSRNEARGTWVQYITIPCCIIAIFVGSYMAAPVTIDFIKYDYATITATVKDDVNPGRRGGFLLTHVYVEDGVSYTNMLKKFKFIEGREYEITYLQRSRAIIDAKIIK